MSVSPKAKMMYSLLPPAGYFVGRMPLVLHVKVGDAKKL